VECTWGSIADEFRAEARSQKPKPEPRKPLSPDVKRRLAVLHALRRRPLQFLHARLPLLQLTRITPGKARFLTARSVRCALSLRMRTMRTEQENDLVEAIVAIVSSRGGGEPGQPLVCRHRSAGIAREHPRPRSWPCRRWRISAETRVAPTVGANAWAVDTPGHVEFSMVRPAARRTGASTCALGVTPLQRTPISWPSRSMWRACRTCTASRCGDAVSQRAWASVRSRSVW